MKSHSPAAIESHSVSESNQTIHIVYMHTIIRVDTQYTRRESSLSRSPCENKRVWVSERTSENENESASKNGSTMIHIQVEMLLALHSTSSQQSALTNCLIAFKNYHHHLRILSFISHRHTHIFRRHAHIFEVASVVVTAAAAAATVNFVFFSRRQFSNRPIKLNEMKNVIENGRESFPHHCAMPENG